MQTEWGITTDSARWTRQVHGMPGEPGVHAQPRSAGSSVGSSACSLTARRAGATSPRLTTDSLHLPGGLSAHLTRGTPPDDVREPGAEPHEEGRLIITVGLQGASAYRGAAGESVAFRDQAVSVTWARHAVGRRLFSREQAVRQVRVGLGEPAVRQYLPALAEQVHAARGGVLAVWTGPASRQVLQLAAALAAHAGRAHVLQTHHMALGIAAEALRPLTSPPSPGSPRFTDAEVLALAQARDALECALDQPMSLAGLALAAGMSEARLRAGFQWCFGASPRDVLLRARMQTARQWLAAGERVSSTAYRVGYAHPANFSTAFTRYFGMPPKAVRCEVST